MSDQAQKILQEALALPPIERTLLIDRLVASLDQPDLRLDQLWADEAQDRLKAYDAGEIETTSAEVVFEELSQL